MTETLENAFAGLREMGSSVGDRDLVQLIARHVQEENEILHSYQAVADRSGNDITRYLVRLIMDDEARHHRLLTEMANAIAWQTPDLSPEPAVPALPLTPTEDGQLARATQLLLDAERRDQAELRRLARQMKPFDKTTAWGLLVDLMRMDTDKHIRILKFVRSCLT